MEQFGVSESDINSITAETNGQSSSLPELERTILRAARDMVTKLKISDSDFENLQISLSNEHLVDLVLTIAFYCGVVRVLATLEIDNEPHYKEALEKFPLPE
jgi:alkylhydroperoxidase family enzyme